MSNKQIAAFIPEEAYNALDELQKTYLKEQGQVTKAYIVSQAIMFYNKVIKEVGTDNIQNISAKNIIIKELNNTLKLEYEYFLNNFGDIVLVLTNFNSLSKKCQDYLEASETFESNDNIQTTIKSYLEIDLINAKEFYPDIKLSIKPKDDVTGITAYNLIKLKEEELEV